MADMHDFDINQILKMLPHRYPFLLVDRILELEPGKTVKALKNISMNEPQFTGHFPEYPIMPGVLILEALAQTAALLTFSGGIEKDDESVYFFVGIDNARFKKPVTPGDQLILNATCERSKGGIWKFKTFATVDDSVVTEADLMCAIRKKEA
jgi:3-hydroxyacyl-[acyl-carrier-protein] dehydratase